MRKVRTILSCVDAHGVVDVFAKYRHGDVWASLYALSRLQHAALLYDRRHEVHTRVNDAELLDNLAHYSVYATAAYGWKMDLAFGRRPRGGNLQTLLDRTCTDRDDVLTVSWESKTPRPAYFVVRDRTRKQIVLSIRGTWS